jgi:hypothetical protein
MHEIFTRLESELASALDGLDNRQSQLTPRTYPEKWTIQQIVEHLLMTYRSTSAILNTRLEKGSPTKSRTNARQLVQQFVVISVGFFPPGRRAPEAVTPTFPASLRAGDDLTRRIREELATLDSIAAQAERLFGPQRCASHFLLGPLSPLQWRKFHLVHGRHHARQIRAIRKDNAV